MLNKPFQSLSFKFHMVKEWLPFDMHVEISSGETNQTMRFQNKTAGGQKTASLTKSKKIDGKYKVKNYKSSDFDILLVHESRDTNVHYFIPMNILIESNVVNQTDGKHKNIGLKNLQRYRIDLDEDITFVENDLKQILFNCSLQTHIDQTDIVSGNDIRNDLDFVRSIDESISSDYESLLQQRRQIVDNVRSQWQLRPEILPLNLRCPISDCSRAHYTFSSKSKCVQHIRNLHPDFDLKPYMPYHARSSEPHYFCETCVPNIGFTFNTNLLKHKRKFHSISC